MQYADLSNKKEALVIASTQVEIYRLCHLFFLRGSNIYSCEIDIFIDFIKKLEAYTYR